MSILFRAGIFRRLACLSALGGLVWCAAASAAPIRPFKIGAAAVPAAIEGRFVRGLGWTDATGENRVVLSVIGERPDPASEFDDRRRADLRAVRFLKRDGAWQKIWTVRDSVEDCEVDILADFIEPSLAVTDVDADGIAEVSFVYRLGCRGGVDPAEQKLIMYEDRQKYALRGMSRIVTRIDGEVSSDGGGMTPDKAFKGAPPELLRFARKQWKLYEVE